MSPIQLESVTSSSDLRFTQRATLTVIVVAVLGVGLILFGHDFNGFDGDEEKIRTLKDPSTNWHDMRVHQRSLDPDQFPAGGDGRGPDRH